MHKSSSDSYTIIFQEKFPSPTCNIILKNYVREFLHII